MTEAWTVVLWRGVTTKLLLQFRVPHATNSWLSQKLIASFARTQNWSIKNNKQIETWQKNIRGEIK